MVCWSELPFDLLEHILSYLPLQDYHMFSVACRSWLSVAKQKRYSPAPQLPWLVLGDDTATKTRRLFSLSGQKHYHMNLPYVYGRRCCGSSHGWLVTVDEKPEGLVYDQFSGGQIGGHLFNPFTGAEIQLPPFPRLAVDRDIFFPPAMENESDEEDDDEEDDGEDIFFPFEVYCHKLVYKAILSADPSKTSDYIVMILYGECNLLAFWRPGQADWNTVNTQTRRFEDAIWYKEKFYCCSHLNHIYVVDPSPNPKVELLEPGNPWGIAWESAYLVDLEGDLLRIHKKVSIRDKTEGFVVWKLDAKNGWIKLKGIGEHALFLGMNSSIAVSARDIPGCKENCIYFTGDGERRPQDIREDLGIYSMEDGKIVPCYPEDAYHSNIFPPIWLFPNPW